MDDANTGCNDSIEFNGHVDKPENPKVTFDLELLVPGTVEFTPTTQKVIQHPDAEGSSSF